MNILLLGATGRVGSVLLAKALRDGHQVVALVRTPGRITVTSPNLQIIHGDVLDEAALEEAMTRLPIEAVVSGLNTDKNNTLSRSTTLLIHLMKKHHVNRLIAIGTAGILDSRVNPKLYRFQSSESKRKTTTAAEDHLAAYHQMQKSALDWTLVCPTYLPEGEETGQYRVEVDMLPADGKQISVQDTAAFAYAQLHDSTFIGKRVGISY
ncbi:NAD-dependent epimerase/dehydratase family protein [Siminovitchia acidinfaciens]|uniref:NAD-dependent epimerase/dehydratase family protein n=1 Tax=Siminovitchia acidinfaciens TaxID=2321395 RepID=A0A429Y3X5_9BACI|nr:NAD(P)H-binding protein [Siminovitchia acidinfaciens]RST76120.1 NAD-dependent epimerase/dehydratase family protein [Siminovitchia acidinfaciens]